MFGGSMAEYAENGAAQLTSEKFEYVKQYVEYDGQDRIQKVFTAPLHVAIDDSCSVTKYAYKDATGSKIRTRLEMKGTWNATMEAAYQALLIV